MTTTNNNKQRRVNHKLENALTVIQNNWFPANAVFLERIKKSLKKSTRYTITELIEDLKRDFALFTHCLRIVGILSARGEIELKDEDRVNPLQILRAVGYEKLKEIILSPHFVIPTFDPETTSRLSTQRTKEALSGASASEMLSKEFYLDPETGFSITLLRQLGTTLISHNFPEQYESAIKLTQERQMHIDDALTRELGFSPRLLGQRIFSEWNFLPEVLNVLDTSFSNKEKEVTFESDFLNRICEIGESYGAIVSNPKDKVAQELWAKSEKALQDSLGQNGFKQIHDKLEKHRATYEPLSKEYEQLKRHDRESESLGERLFRSNPYIERCPEFLQADLEELYKTIHANAVSEKGLYKLSKEIAPKVGFERGCVFFLDPEKMFLEPKFKVGDFPEDEFRIIDCLERDATHPLAVALFTRFPSVQRRTRGNGENFSFIAAPFGKGQNTVLLYLELSDQMLAVPGASPLSYFKAIQKAYIDCLNLGAAT